MSDEKGYDNETDSLSFFEGEFFVGLFLIVVYKYRLIATLLLAALGVAVDFIIFILWDIIHQTDYVETRTLCKDGTLDIWWNMK
jgi:hypothetical protein